MTPSWIPLLTSRTPRVNGVGSFRAFRPVRTIAAREPGSQRRRRRRLGDRGTSFEPDEDDADHVYRYMDPYASMLTDRNYLSCAMKDRAGSVSPQMHVAVRALSLHDLAETHRLVSKNHRRPRNRLEIAQIQVNSPRNILLRRLPFLQATRRWGSRFGNHGRRRAVRVCSIP